MAHRDLIVVGASAGGVPALQTLVAGLSPKMSATVLIVLHIPPHTPSQLHAILSRAGTIEVTAAEDGEPILPGRAYVAPSDRHLLVETDRLRVTRGPKENRVRPAIDTLFRSAAYSFGERVVGIVLSGMLDDGTAGLWSIKDRGGLALVQSPSEAEQPSMPESALQYVAIDAALPVAKMPAYLNEMLGKPIRADGAGEPSKIMEIETKIALEGNALQRGVMDLGPVSPNTCPECHGVLVRIREGDITRYRCHTGHAYSLQTLLADVNQEIDSTLWGAIRAIEERILLLREMEEAATKHNDANAAKQCRDQAQAAEEGVHQVRDLALSHTLLGRVTGIRSPHSRAEAHDENRPEASR